MLAWMKEKIRKPPPTESTPSESDPGESLPTEQEE